MTKPDLAPSKEPNQLKHKITLTRESDAIQGNCWWPGYSLTRNSNGSATALAADWQKTPALVPVYAHLSGARPEIVEKVRIKGDMLSWKASPKRGKSSDAVKYVVYKFDSEKDVDLEDSECIVAITTDNSVQVPGKGVYVVTAVDHVNNESEPSLYVRKK